MATGLDHNQIGPNGAKAWPTSTPMSLRVSSRPSSSVWSVYGSPRTVAVIASTCTPAIPSSEACHSEKLALFQAWEESDGLFSETERAALVWAEAVIRVAETGVPDEACRVASSVFSDTQLVDLMIAIRLMNTYDRMAISCRKTPLAVITTRRRVPYGGRCISKEHIR